MKYVAKVTPEESRMIQELAFANNFPGWWKEGQTVQHTDKEYLYFNPKDKKSCFTYDNFFVSGNLLVTAVELAKLTSCVITEENLNVRQVRIGEYDVTIKSGDFIKFGCTTLKKDEVTEIIKIWNRQK